MKFLLVAAYSGANFNDNDYNGITVRNLGTFTDINEAIEAAIKDDDEVAKEYYNEEYCDGDKKEQAELVAYYTEERYVYSGIENLKERFNQAVGMTAEVVSNSHDSDGFINEEVYTLIRIE